MSISVIEIENKIYKIVRLNHNWIDLLIWDKLNTDESIDKVGIIMINLFKQTFKYLFLFIMGGIIYYYIEIAYRQHSHWTMLILGGTCYVLIGAINEVISWEMALWKQMLIGSGIITVLEFITGVIVNIILRWNVWDYSNVPFNVLGQICAPFMIVWFFISLLAIVVDDYTRYWFFGEEKPHYTLI